MSTMIPTLEVYRLRKDLTNLGYACTVEAKCNGKAVACYEVVNTDSFFYGSENTWLVYACEDHDDEDAVTQSVVDEMEDRP